MGCACLAIRAMCPVGDGTWLTLPLLQVGAEGAGHYVKMVHNGIEYGDMQLCCEAYHLMKVRDNSAVAAVARG